MNPFEAQKTHNNKQQNETTMILQCKNGKEKAEVLTLIAQTNQQSTMVVGNIIDTERSDEGAPHHREMTTRSAVAPLDDNSQRSDATEIGTQHVQ
jgi:hypothetical protein